MLERSITVTQSRNGKILETTESTPTFDFTSSPNGFGKARVAGTITGSTPTFTLASHGLAQNEPIHITNLGSVTGLSLDTLYYVVNVTTNDFQLSLTKNGVAIAWGGTIGTFDFVEGYRTRASVSQSLYKTYSYGDSVNKYSAYLTAGTFIPKNTTEDKTTLTSDVMDGADDAIIKDSVYNVGLIAFWATNHSIVVTNSTTLTVSGINISELYESYGFIWLSPSELLRIDTITWNGTNTVITLIDATTSTGTITSGNWNIGNIAQFSYLAYYSVLVGWNELFASLTLSDFNCSCTDAVTPRFRTSQELSMLIQAALAARNNGKYTTAQEMIESATKIVNRINGDCEIC